MLRTIGEEVGTWTGVPFYFEDFRPYYQESRTRARELGLYRQNYCGCLFSKLERARRRSERAIVQHLTRERK